MNDKKNPQHNMQQIDTLLDVVLGKIFQWLVILPILIFLVTTIPAFFTMVGWNWVYGWLGTVIGHELQPMPFIVAWGINILLGIYFSRKNLNVGK